MPPRISSKVDVWSAGVIFYQMLYGKEPFGNYPRTSPQLPAAPAAPSVSCLLAGTCMFNAFIKR